VSRQGGSPSYRFGAVLAATLAVVLFQIGAADNTANRVIGMALQGATLTAVVLTSGAPRVLRRVAAAAVGLVAVTILVTIVSGQVPNPVAFGITVIFVFGALPAVGYGVVYLIRARGVTLQVVAGALTAYLLVGLLFTAAIGVAAALGGPYFGPEHGDGTIAERTYFSFTSMTTTGYGDFAPATRGGRALAVLEMLIGQLYLVTVVGVLVGNLATRRRGAGGDS
jgi:hypothetical protein